jgi:AbrB family looped-hinge helix DNA binding protein
MAAVIVDRKRRLIVPEEVVASLGLASGDRVALTVRKDGVVEMRPETVDLLSLCGSIKPRVRGVSVEDMNEAIRKAAGKP